MDNEIIFRIRRAISKYKERLYNEKDFQTTIAGIVPMITEYEFYDFRDFLDRIAETMEMIDFTTDDEFLRENYLIQIKRIESFLNQHDW